MMDENLKKFLSENQLQNIKNTIPVLPYSVESVDKTNEFSELLRKELIGRKAQEQIDSVRLRQIEENSQQIEGLLEILRDNSYKQNELMSVMLDILLISQAKDADDANGKYRTVMDKINKFKEDFDTFEFLYVSAKSFLKWKLAEFGLSKGN